MCAGWLRACNQVAGALNVPAHPPLKRGLDTHWCRSLHSNPRINGVIPSELGLCTRLTSLCVASAAWWLRICAFAWLRDPCLHVYLQLSNLKPCTQSCSRATRWRLCQKADGERGRARHRSVGGCGINGTIPSELSALASSLTALYVLSNSTIAVVAVCHAHCSWMLKPLSLEGVVLF